MLLEHEAGRREARDVGRAAGDVEEAVARAAVKVVVMVLSGPLVAGRLAGKAHGLKPSVVDERADGPIDGGDTEARNPLGGEGEDLLRAERAFARLEDLANRAALAGISPRR